MFLAGDIFHLLLLCTEKYGRYLFRNDCIPFQYLEKNIESYDLADNKVAVFTKMLPLLWTLTDA